MYSSKFFPVFNFTKPLKILKGATLLVFEFNHATAINFPRKVKNTINIKISVHTKHLREGTWHFTYTHFASYLY